MKMLQKASAFQGVLEVVDAGADAAVVRCLPAISNATDSVNDCILPGAFGKSLDEFTPRCCDSHDWSRVCGKLVDAEEWLPGDPRLPADLQALNAGALYAAIEFNTDTTMGMECLSNVRFFGSDQQWSVGYTVPAGGERVNARGINEISEIRIWEVSPVLAAAMALTRSLKRRDALTPVPAELFAAYMDLVHDVRVGFGDSHAA